MEINLTLTNKVGQSFKIIYNDIDHVEEIQNKKITGVYAYCFYGDQLVIVNENGYTGNPGGRLEENESVVDALQREVKEETNMEILSFKPVGIHETIRPSGESVFYVRFACLVKPFAEFKKDPTGKVSVIQFIDPSEFVSLCDSQWGEMAERMIERAIDAKKNMK